MDTLTGGVYDTRQRLNVVVFVGGGGGGGGGDVCAGRALQLAWERLDTRYAVTAAGTPSASSGRRESVWFIGADCKSDDASSLR